jgi:tetratricopeptide (TPR) repeat protein
MRPPTLTHLLRRRWPLLGLAVGLILAQLPTLISAGYNNLGGLTLNRAQIEPGITPAEQAAAYTAAGRDFQQALKLAPGYGRPYANLGAIYTDFSDTEAAAQAYTEATRYAPDDRLAQYFYGHSLDARGDETAAREAWTAAQAAGVFLRQANALKNSDPEGALLNAERALAIAPDAPESILALGKVLTAQKQYTDALALYEDASARTPEEPDYYREAGILLRRHLDRAGDAIRVLEQAIWLQPEDEAARLELARAHSALGACYEAEAWLTQLLSHTPLTSAEVQAHTITGQCHLAQGRPQTAIPYLTAAVSGDTPSISTLLLLAGAYKAVARPDNARDTYTRVLELKPDNAAALAALDELAEAVP